VNLSSVRELEAKNAGDRKKLMQAIFRYLGQLEVKARLIQEPAVDSSGVSVVESIIELRDQKLDSIRLVSADSGGALRFQFSIKLEKELQKDSVQKLEARTKTIKTGKVLGLFGGKAVDVKWVGQGLADSLNQDHEISQMLLRCTQLLGDMDYFISAASLSEVRISCPWFTNPNTIIALYAPGKIYEEQNCILGYETIDRIAQIIQGKVLNISSEKQEALNVMHQA
jgi:hypothetical protein